MNHTNTEIKSESEKKMDTKQFVNERDKAAKSYDVATFREFYTKWMLKGAYVLPLPSNDRVIEITMRKMVYHANSSTVAERLEAKRWLEERGCTTEL